jgi:RimJ/RimL family protein N-acetyltransferase
MAPRVELRPVTEQDLPTLYEHQRDPEAAAMAVFPSRDRDAFERHWATILADPEKVAWAVLADGAVAGNVVSWDADGTRLVGYWIGREHWGRGIATAGLAAFLQVETRRPLHALVVARNVGSIRVLEKCGFVRVDEDLSTDEEVEELVYRLDG